MTDHNEIMTESIRELIAIGASVGAHCQPCLEHHIKASVALGVSEEDIRAAIAIGHTVEKGALSAMKKFSSHIAEELLQAAGTVEKQLAGAAVEKGSTETILKIYDPAMCCSSGVCGPSVDPVLAQFAGTVKFIETQPGVRVERYNLGQQPQAFVDNARVKAMLGNGGDKELPFIFLGDQLWLKGRYPSRAELLDALKIKNDTVLAPFSAQTGNACCCGDGGCC